MILSCGHDKAMAILHRDGRTAWCFICEKDVHLAYPWQVLSDEATREVMR